MNAAALPDEPIVALDEVESEKGLLHPLEAAVSTIVQVQKRWEGSNVVLDAASRRRRRQLALPCPSSGPHRPSDHALTTAPWPQAFSTSPPTVFLAREGRERELMAALLALYRCVLPLP